MSLVPIGCGEDTASITREQETTSKLRPESELAPGCYEWTVSGSRPTSVDYRMPMEEGDPAIDFTLEDLDGQPHTLSTLLKSRPVVMVMGAFT